MPNIFVPFTGWDPGGSQFGEGWVTASNVLPIYGDYRPARKFLPLGAGEIDDPMSGAYTHAWANSAPGAYADAQTIFTGSSGGYLYTIDPATGAFTDISRAAGPPPYTANAAGWRFASIGNDIWAADWIDVPQRRTNNAGNFANGVTSTFVPRPRFLAAFADRLLVANLSNAGRFQDELAWSDLDNAVNFDPPTGTSSSLAGAKRLVSIPGQITGLVGGERYGFAFKRRGIFYLEATGTIQVVRPEVLSLGIGTALPSSIINSRYGVFFLGPDGIYRISGVSEPQKVSTPGVDQFLLESGLCDVTATSFTSAWQEDTQMVGYQSAHWPLVGWILRPNWASNIGNNTRLDYNPMTGAWTTSSTASSPLVPHAPYVMVERPYAENVYEVLAAITHLNGRNYYSPYADTAGTGGVNMWGAELGLRFRPVNHESALPMQQTLIEGVTPIFSKAGPTGTFEAAVEASVKVEIITDPSQTTAPSETRTWAERNVVSGEFPFQIAGRWPRITVTVPSQDFDNFHGVWVRHRLLT